MLHAIASGDEAEVLSDGQRCNERRFVEFHHVDPYALGGEGSVDGVQLRCRRHNDYLFRNKLA
jgi:hypothetical protein